jgi:hypothetical protein
LCLIFTIHANLNDPMKILETRSRNWSTFSSLMFFIVGGQHTI